MVARRAVEDQRKIQFSASLLLYELAHSAYSPDLPGCVSTGRTRSEVEASMREAIELHLEGLLMEGYPVPEPQSEYGYSEVAAA